MKRTPLIITFIIIVLAGGAIWFYQFYNSKKATAWDLIGNDAAIVFELSSVTSFHEKLAEISLVGNLIKSDFAISRLTEIMPLVGSKLFVSIHPISFDDFGIVIYSEISKVTNDTKFLSLQKGETVKEREYNGLKINEIQLEGRSILSYAVVDNIILISTSSFLIEGALRLRSTEDIHLFKNSNSTLFKLPTLKSDEGNAYFNISNFVASRELFLLPNASKNKYKLSGNGLADLRLGEETVLINGFVEDDENGVLSLFRNQEPQVLDFDQLVSNNVSSLTHYGFSNTDLWFKEQKNYLENRNVVSTDSLEKELSRLSIGIESLRKSVGNQFATCNLSTGNQVTILKLKDAVDQISVFDELSSKVSTEKRDSLYLENYAGYQIKLIDYRNLLYQLFYPLSEPSSQSYFTRIGSYLIISENVELVKLFIDDIDNENTWGKTVDWNKFLSTSLQESNISLFFDGKLATVYFREIFKSKWKHFFDSTSFLGIDKGSIQLSRLESNYYLNASLQFYNPELRLPKRQLQQTTYDFGSEIVRPSTIVKSHVSKEIEIMIQDSIGNLYLLSKGLKTQWKRIVSAPIADDIQEIDFFANGKIQYFFIAGESLYLIDRLGRSVEGFPKSIHSKGIEFGAVIDYDRSKRYRYLMTDLKGNLILTDKNGSLLEGWDPKALGGRMLRSAKHYRILGKDYFIALQQNGVANLMNRRGEMLKGFPLELGIRPMGDFFLTLKNSQSANYFTVVSGDGMKVEFGVDGQIKKREALIKRIGMSKFSLVKSKLGDSFVFLRVDPGKIATLDVDGRAIFEIENQGSTDWELSYLENRLKERFYCFYDTHQNFAYICDGQGQFLLPQPLESTQHPTLYYDEKLKSLIIYNVNSSRVTQISIKN